MTLKVYFQRKLEKFHVQMKLEFTEAVSQPFRSTAYATMWHQLQI